MKRTQVPANATNEANQRLWEALGDHADKVAARINSDPEFVAKIARFIVSSACEPLTSQKDAREIMGKNFFGIEEAIKHFRINPAKQDLAALTEVPFSEEVLKSCKDTHILVAVFPLSILDIRDRFGKTLFFPQGWYCKQVFAKHKGGVSWQLVRKEPIPYSAKKTWEEQRALLPKDEVIPTTRIMVYAIIGHFLATGERLFDKIFVRCVDLVSDKYRVFVGYFDQEGLSVNRRPDDRRRDGIGLSAARKQ